jgi:uncharacterized phiE125 gp8 family phage protein
MRVQFTTNYDPLDVLSLNDAKEQLRIPLAITDEDDIHERMIAAAVATIQNLTGRVLGECELEFYFDDVPDDSRAFLPFSPLTVTAVDFKDSAGNYVAQVEGTDYEVSTLGIVPRIRFLSQPSGSGFDRIVIKCNAGFTDVPAPLKHAVALMVVHFDENRSQTITPVPLREIPKGVDAIISPYRNEFFV